VKASTAIVGSRRHERKSLAGFEGTCAMDIGYFLKLMA
jgi:hypothetical protein